MIAPGAKRLFALIWFVLGLNAVAGAYELESPFFTVHARSHHQVRTRASRTTRVNLDHAIEHIDDEHASEQSPDSQSLTAVVATAPQLDRPRLTGDIVHALASQPLAFAVLPIRAGRAPPSPLYQFPLPIASAKR